MHVLHIETGRHLYGGAGQVLQLARGLPALGCQSTLVCAAGSEVAAAALGAGLPMHALPAGGDLDARLLPNLYRLIGKLRPDLVHLHSRRGADSWGLLAARLGGGPVVLTRRVDNPDVPLLRKLRYQLCDRIVAISAGVEAQLRRDGAPASKLRRVVSAVVPEACQPRWPVDRFRAEFDLRPGQPTIGVIAQLIPRKGHRQLLQVLPQVIAACPDARVLLFGRGPMEARLRSEFAAAGLQSQVRLIGYRADLLDFLGHLELVLHPAYREGLGIALLEAQAAGVPVVGFRIPGLVEAVDDGRSGLLVPPGDLDALAAAISRLLWNPRLRAQLADGAREQVRRHFSLEGMLQGNLDVYQELLGANK